MTFGRAALIGCWLVGCARAAAPASGATSGAASARGETDEVPRADALAATGEERVSLADGAASAPAVSAAPGSLMRLAVPGHGDALVAVPAGEQPKPLLIAAGGAGDRPDWQCRAWTAIVAGRAFVLCVRGLPLNPRAAEPDQQYYFKSHIVLEREVLEAVRALQGRFGARVDTTDIVYAGFSQGATMGALVVLRNPERFARAVLIEGGIYDWTDSAALGFRRAGGERVLFACGQANCVARARRSRDALERAGVSARAVFGAGGHTYEGGVADELRANFDWLVDGARGW